MRIVETEGIVQGTPEWRALRLGKPSASRLDAICAKGKGSAMATTREDYLYELASERLTGVPYESFHSIYMDDGKDNEGIARSEYEALYGFVTEHPGQELNGFWASPDGLCDTGGVEIKNLKTKNHIKIVTTGNVDRKYILQMAGNVLVYDADWWDFFSYDAALAGQPCSMFKRRFYRGDLPINEIKQEIAQFLTELDSLCEKLRGIK